MRIGVPKEAAPGERRVALVPESCKKLIQAGYEVSIEAGAGEAAGFPDAAYRDAGAAVETDSAALLGSADLVLKVGPAHREPRSAAMRPGAIYLGSLMPLRNLEAVRALAAAQDHRLLHRRHPADHAGAVDGHALVDGQHRRLQGRAARRGGAQQVLPDAHDRGGHGAARPRCS